VASGIDYVVTSQAGTTLVPYTLYANQVHIERGSVVKNAVGSRAKLLSVKRREVMRIPRLVKTGGMKRKKQRNMFKSFLSNALSEPVYPKRHS
jgi:hypothetical protein